MEPLTSARSSPVPPDIGRVGSSQEECRARIWLVEDGEVHDIYQVVGNSVQVHPPGIVALHLHQVSEQELPQLQMLPQKGITYSSVKARRPQAVLPLSILPSTAFSHAVIPLCPHSPGKMSSSCP